MQQVERANVASECLDHVNTMLLRGSLFGIAGAGVLALLIGDAVPAGRRALWFGLVTIATIASFLAALRYHVVRRRRVITRWPVGFVTTVVLALAWASIAWIAFPSADHGALRAVILLFCLATSASGIVASGASRLRFFAYQIPLIVPLSITYFAHHDHVTRLLGVAFPIYLVGMSAMHHEVHKVITSEMHLRNELRAANDQLREVALHDWLTGLNSRAAFNEMLEAAISQARRTDETIGLLFFDIDRFKSINDAYGHATGDAILVEVADRVRPLVRTEDCFARLGGDEYAIVLRNLARPDDARVVADRLRDKFARLAHVDGRAIDIDVSIGVAVTRRGELDAPALLQAADTAQYRAKRNDGSSVVVFDAVLRSQLHAAASIAHEMRDAIAGGQIVAYFQPEIDLDTGAVIGAEALARWRHPQRGVLTAGEFLQTATEIQLLDAIDRSIFDDALRARTALRDRGLVGDDFRIWLNVVGSRLTLERFRMLEAWLTEHDCPLNHFGIEITEQQVLADIGTAAACLAAASDAGMAVALDDFGTGSSSLSLVRDLPIDVLKIDQRFVRDVTLNRVDEAIIEAIVTLGRRLGVQVTAEGVETCEHEATLRRLGCTQAQGFLYAPALPFDDLATTIVARNTVAASSQ